MKIVQPDLIPRRTTLVLPEHLNDLKHSVHCEYGQIESTNRDGQWLKVVWIEGVDPNTPRRTPIPLVLDDGEDD